MPTVVVIGAGHAGIEAAYAAARLGCKTILLTIHLETIGQMSCNPSIGGIAKGHLVKEIDAFAGLMPRAADATGIHFKTLNRSNGPAVRASRTQNDKIRYRNYMKRFLEQVENLEIYQSVASRLQVKNGRVAGVELLEGGYIEAGAVIITGGTFLNGKIYIGNTVYSAGRANEPASTHLAGDIRKLGFQVRRLKTGTPMRLHRDSIDWHTFKPQPGDEPPIPFFMFTRSPVKNRVTCYLGYTGPALKKVIEDHLHLSPLYGGRIEGIGPRYCPSIEDKIVKFPHRSEHHFFLEPEGIDNKEVYVNGLSTSLPVEVQNKILKAIPGLDRAVMMRPAYAIEYDAIEPTQLHHSLESKSIGNLFFAGQVNGTSGYEEAAAQGLMAGINAVLKLQDRPPLVLGRHEAYIGVMIDDIVSKGVDEPYRLFTSRAEYRLQLREDNAFERLSPYALDLGLIGTRVFNRENRRLAKRKGVIDKLKEKKLLYQGKTAPLSHLLKMPEIDFIKLEELWGAPLMESRTLADISYIEANVKYEGYIQLQEKNIVRLQNLEQVTLPEDIDYLKVSGLSTEVRQKLQQRRPRDLKEALALPGVTPAAINAISIHLTLHHRESLGSEKDRE